MNELYWITRLGTLHEMGCVLFAISLAFVVFLFLFIVMVNPDPVDVNKVKTYAKTALIPIFIGLIMMVFIPTKEEALFIYGVKGTIDYIKSNDKSKELPDEVIKALDEWLGSQNKGK